MSFSAPDSTGPADETVKMSSVNAPETEDDEVEENESVFSKTGSDYNASMTSPARVGLVDGSGPGFRTEQTTLLRSRLSSVAIFVAAAYGLLFLAGLTVIHVGSTLALVTAAIRCLISIGVVALIAAKPLLPEKDLRKIEYGYIGLLVFFMLLTQSIVNSSYIHHGQYMEMIANEKNGILGITILMVLYAALIPNPPKRTVRVIMLMAAAPIVAFAIVVTNRPEDLPPDIRNMRNDMVISNCIFVILTACLAIYLSRILHRLRKELHAARKLGQYQLGEKLGEGGMGEVYLAEHQLLKRPSALKLIRQESGADPLAIARFEREVQSAAMLSHPNTIQIFDYGHTDDGTFYYVMEYLAGLSLSDLVKNFGPLPFGRAIYLLRQACDSLAEAHRMGLVHRDLKPANLFVAVLGGKCDVIKVLDFGLVKVQSTPGTVQLTAEYTVSGTPSFMAPEQATGAADLDGRADLYALGAILYYILTGKPPFEGENAVALMIAHASAPVNPPTQIRADIPADLEQVVMRCLSKSPAERFKDASELEQALAACASASEWNQQRAKEWWAEVAGTAQAIPEDGAGEIELTEAMV